MRIAALLLLALPALGQVLVRQSLTGVHTREVQAPRCITWKGPLRPFTCDGVPLFFNAAQPARVFDPNPVAAINDPSLMDDNDSPAAVPARAYRDVPLDLLGPNLRVVDRQPPSTPPPDPNAPLLFDRGDDRFEPVNAAFHIDRLQRHLQSLGYAGARQLVPYAIEVDALVATGADTSFFVPSFIEPGRGALYYGIGGTDDAEDGDIVVHEYGHAVLEWIAPGTFGGAFSSESRALSEGFGDYLAFSAHYEQRVASGRDPFCFADWDARCWTDAPSEGCGYPAGSDCLRRLDSPSTMADYQRLESPGVEHRNGQIWSSALRELFLRLGRRTTDILVVESLFDAPPRPTFAVMARRIIEVDQLLYGGVDRELICGVMTARGIAVSCDGTPRGELTHVPNVDRAIPIPDRDPNGIVSRITVTDPRAIERIAVRVDIDHPSRGDLRIELVAPDGRRVLLQNVSTELARDIHATYGIDAAPAESLDVLRGRPAAGTWELRVSDERSRDVGTLQSWALVIQFAGGEPQTERPRAEQRQMIPVVAHLFGAGTTAYASDLHLANVTAAPQTATLIFTRSGANGLVAFSAVDVQLAAGQSARFGDVVATVFLTAGSGTLEILGDVLAWSRLYTTMPDGGTVGQEVPADLPLSDAPLLVTSLPLRFGAARYNLGLAETSGVRTRVRVNGDDFVIEPFSHLQIPGIESATITADGGGVVAYLSQVDSSSGDAMFLAAEPRGGPVRIAPAIYAEGANGTTWRTDLWSMDPFEAVYRSFRFDRPAGAYHDVVRETIGLPFTAGALVLNGPGFATTRVFNGRTSQVIPFRPLDDRRERHLIGLDNGATHRTNIGIVSDGDAAAEVIVYDAGGSEIERHALTTLHGIAQTGLCVAVTGGRAVVRITSGRARAYASVIDVRSGDAAFVEQ